MTQEPTVDEARDALVRALKSGQKFDYIVIYDRREAWLWRAAELAVEQGWLEEGRLVELDEQSSELRFYLTPAGRALA